MSLRRPALWICVSIIKNVSMHLYFEYDVQELRILTYFTVYVYF